MSPTAIKVRYALTLSGPDFFPANVKKIELIVQQQEARIAADSPTKPEGKYLTLGLKRNYFGFNLFQLSMALMLYAYSDRLAHENWPSTFFISLRHPRGFWMDDLDANIF
jgi:hypothetical protein